MVNSTFTHDGFPRVGFVNFWIQLFKLAIHRKSSRENYFKFQAFQANRVIKDVIKIIPLDTRASVIDYGCGSGGYTNALAHQFKEVVGVDYFIQPLREKIIKLNNVRFESADLITYAGDPTDLLFCASVIEHIPVEKQSSFIENLKRNIKKNGYLYLSFPPFKSIIGGHVCAPFHYFPDPISFYLTKIIKNHNIHSYETMFGNWGLSKTSIQQIEKLLLEHGFRIIRIKPRYLSPGWTNVISKNNFLNWHVEFFCQNI